jgi:hypothetical protein
MQKKITVNDILIMSRNTLKRGYRKSGLYVGKNSKRTYRKKGGFSVAELDRNEEIMQKTVILKNKDPSIKELLAIPRGTKISISRVRIESVPDMEVQDHVEDGGKKYRVIFVVNDNSKNPYYVSDYNILSETEVHALFSTLPLAGPEIPDNDENSSFSYKTTTEESMELPSPEELTESQPPDISEPMQSSQTPDISEPMESQPPGIQGPIEKTRYPETFENTNPPSPEPVIERVESSPLPEKQEQPAKKPTTLFESFFGTTQQKAPEIPEQKAPEVPEQKAPEVPEQKAPEKEKGLLETLLTPAPPMDQGVAKQKSNA